MKFIFLKTIDICSNYMYLFKKDYVDCSQLNEWADFIKSKLQKEHKNTCVYNKMCLSDMKDSEYQGFFCVYNGGVGLAQDKTLQDVSTNFCVYTDVDVLLVMCNTFDEYKEIQESKQFQREI